MWTDTTSSVQGKPKEIEEAFSRDVRKGSRKFFRIVITRQHRDYPGKWVMHFYPVVNEIVLCADTVPFAEAQELATTYCRELLQDAVDALGAVR